MFFARDSIRRTSARTSQAMFDELARLHDHRQAPAILSEHLDVRERISVHDQ